MSEITRELLDGTVGNPPLEAYPWKDCADRLIEWSKHRSSAHRAFAFDLLMSLAYVDTIPSIQNNFKAFEGGRVISTPILASRIFAPRYFSKRTSGTTTKQQNHNLEPLGS